MKSCEEYQELISRLLDGELTEEEQRDVQRHIASCPDCAAMYEAFRALSYAIEEGLEEPPESLHETVMADVRREALRRRQAPKRVRGLLAMAACAALVLLAAANLPRMGAQSSMLAAPQAAEEAAAVVENYDMVTSTAAEEAEAPAEAPPADLYAASPSEDSAPSAGAAMDDGAKRAASEAVEAPAVPAPLPEPEPEPETAISEAAEPEAPEAQRLSAWLFVLVGLPLIGAAVLLLTRKKPH